MFDKITKELIDGRKTYSVSGFAFISNILEKLPESIPEWTELFNLGAAILAFVLVAWRLGHKIKNKDKE